MNTGEMRLHWDDNEGMHVYETFPCLDDALNRAAKVYGMSEGTLIRLENWFGEDACPADQLLPIAKLRSDVQADLMFREDDQAAMEAAPGWGSF